eukprot:469609-Lingulodinium_polyedra.AAC.1
MEVADPFPVKVERFGADNLKEEERSAEGHPRLPPGREIGRPWEFLALPPPCRRLVRVPGVHEPPKHAAPVRAKDREVN